MHISFAVFADAANLSQEGKLNVMGIFDALQVGTFPSIHPRAHLVVRLKGTSADVGRHPLVFRWVNPNGNELWNSSGDLQIEPAGDPTVDIDLPVIAVVDLPLDTPGRYAMHVELDNTPMTLLNVFVAGPAPSLGSFQPRSTPLPA